MSTELLDSQSGLVGDFVARQAQQRGITLLPEPNGNHLVLAAPSIQEQLAFITAPSPDLLWSPHNATPFVLFKHACEALERVLAPEDPSRQRLADEAWRISSRLYSPGRSVRDSLMNMLNERLWAPAGTGAAPVSGREEAQQVAQLAVWAVIQGLTDWLADE